MRITAPRAAIGSLTLLVIFGPIGLIVYQSLLTAPFFFPDAKFAFSSFTYIFGDPGFWSALKNSLLLGLAMIAISLPIGSLFAFLIVRTDFPGEPGSSLSFFFRC